jgi:hypothetical protein
MKHLRWLALAIPVLAWFALPSAESAQRRRLYAPIILESEPTLTPVGTATPTATSSPTATTVVIPPSPTATNSPTPTMTTEPTDDGPACDPAYPTVCIPSPPPDLNCADIEFRRFQVLAPDPHGFDTDGDGVGCES